MNPSTVFLLYLSSAADHEVENVFDGESSNDTSNAREILDKPNDTATNTDDTFTNLSDAPARLVEPVEMQVFSVMIPKDSNHKVVFRVDNIDNNDDTIIDDENEKNKEREDYDRSDLQGGSGRNLTLGNAKLNTRSDGHVVHEGTR